MKISTHHSPKNYWGRRTSAEHTTVFRNLLFLLLLLLLSASGLLAQNFPPASNCSSKDLDMVEMLLQADQMGMDYQSGRRRMKVTVTNRTGTDRKSFVVWGTLNRYDSYGKFKSQEPLFVCVDNVQRNSTVTLPGKDSLNYNEDETIVVTNIYTAWSSASINENCETISADPSKIAPRCAVKQSLKVYTGVNARFRHLQGNCDNNGVGRVHARPFGGLGPYKVGIKNEKDESVAVGQEMINEADSAAYDLPPGIYKLTMMDGKNNASVFTRIVDAPPPFTSPEVEVNHPDCQLPKGLVKVKNRDNVAKYRLMQNGITLPNSLQEDQFADVESGDYELIAERGICRGQKKFSVLPRPFVPELPDVAVTHPDCIVERGKLKVRNPQASVKYFLRQNEIVLDSAAVDEFASVASGEYQVEAKGLRCGLRNKVVVNPKPPRPEKPKVDKLNPSCTAPKGLVRLVNRDNNATYHLVNNGIILPFDNDEQSVESGDYSLVATRGTCTNAELVYIAARPFIPKAASANILSPSCTVATGKVTLVGAEQKVSYYLSQNNEVKYTAEANEFSAVVSGSYQLVAKDLQGQQCSTISPNPVVIAAQPRTPATPQLNVTAPSFCNAKGSVIITSPNDAGLQYSNDSGATWHSSGTFSELAAGSGSSLNFMVSLTTGGQRCSSSVAKLTCAAPLALTEEVGGSSASSGLTSTTSEASNESTTSEKKDARYLGIGKLTEATVTLKPVPNPFQTTVRFLINSPEAGRAVLDIFNGQGQLIKTVYQGYVYEGASYYDLILPRTQKNADLVYVFRIGNKVVTGKLIQLGNKF